MNTKRSLLSLETDVDCRLIEQWAALEEYDVDEDTRTLVATFMRAAYGRGYCDALTEPDRARLHRAHGYEVPKRAAR